MPHSMGVMLFRSSRVAPYSRTTIAQCLTLQAHLQAATRRIERFSTLQAERDLLEAVAQGSGRRVVLSTAGDVLWMSPKLARRLKRNDILLRDLGELAKSLALACARTTSPISTTRALLETSNGEKTLVELGYLDQLQASAPLIEAELTPLHAPNHPAAARLSKAEQVVAALVATGAATPQIAQLLFVSAETVRTHTKRIFAKLGVRNRTQLAPIAAALTSSSGTGD